MRGKIITVGCHYLFAYPGEFVTLPDYSAHRGQMVEVIGPVPEDQYENLGDMMWRVRAADGWEGDAFESELLFPTEVTGEWP